MKSSNFITVACMVAVIFVSAGRAQSQPEVAPAYEAESWVSTGGPIGGLGYDVRHSFEDLNKWYVTDAWGGIFLSRDRGIHWETVNQGITTRKGNDGIPVFCVAVDPHNSNNVWIGTEQFGKIYKSENGGESWVEKSVGISDTLMPLTFRGITIDPVDPDIMFAMAEIASAAWHPNGEGARGLEMDLTMGIVYRSVDGGESWREVWRGNNLARYCLINPLNTQEMYVSTGIFDREAANTIVEEGIAGGVGILKSDDGGETWRVLNESNGLMDLYVGSLFMHPLHPDTLLAAASQNNWSAYGEEYTGGIYLTADGGENWEKLSEEEELFAVVEYCTCDPDVAYVVSSSAVYRSEDGGFTWQRFARENDTWGPPGIIAGLPIDMLCDPEDPMRIMVNNYLGGNFLSVDGGESWMIASDGYTGSLLRDLSVSPENPALIYAGSRSGVYYSENGGGNWFGMANPPEELSSKFNEIATLEVNPWNDMSLRTVAMDYPGVLYSFNGGKSWEVSEQFVSLLDMKFFPNDTSILYGLVSDLNKITIPEDIPVFQEKDSILGLYRSLDGGIQWEQIENDMIKGKWIASFAVHPHHPDVLYVSLCDGTFLITEDGGFSWYRPESGLPEVPALSIEVSKSSPQILYAGLGYMIPTMGHGLFKSEDGGMNWKRLTTGLEVNPLIKSIAIDPSDETVVYIADFLSGVFYTTSGGEEWHKLESGLTHREVNKLELSSDGSVLYAGTEGGGVFRLGEVAADPTHVSINQFGDHSIAFENSFPNPFSTVSTMNFSVLNRCKVVMAVYNSSGQLVKVLTDQTYHPGRYSVRWDGKHADGSSVDNGLYVIRIQAGNQSRSVKIAFIR